MEEPSTAPTDDSSGRAPRASQQPLAPAPARARPRVWPMFVAYVVSLVASMVLVGLLFARRDMLAQLGIATSVALERLMVAAATTQVALLGTMLVFTRPLSGGRLRLR